MRRRAGASGSWSPDGSDLAFSPEGWPLCSPICGTARRKPTPVMESAVRRPRPRSPTSRRPAGALLSCDHLARVSGPKERRLMSSPSRNRAVMCCACLSGFATARGRSWPELVAVRTSRRPQALAPRIIAEMNKMAPMVPSPRPSGRIDSASRFAPHSGTRRPLSSNIPRPSSQAGARLARHKLFMHRPF